MDVVPSYVSARCLRLLEDLDGGLLEDWARVAALLHGAPTCQKGGQRWVPGLDIQELFSGGG